jgi:hypothetical protein
MKKIMAILIILIEINLIYAGCFFGGGRPFAAFDLINTPRETSLGGCSTATSEGAMSIFYNPSRLYNSKNNYKLSFEVLSKANYGNQNSSFSVLSKGFQYNQLAVSYRINDNSLAIGWANRIVNDIYETAYFESTNEIAFIDDFKVNENYFILGYSIIGDLINQGYAFKMYNLSYKTTEDRVSNYSFGFTAGMNMNTVDPLDLTSKWVQDVFIHIANGILGEVEFGSTLNAYFDGDTDDLLLTNDNSKKSFLIAIKSGFVRKGLLIIPENFHFHTDYTVGNYDPLKVGLGVEWLLGKYFVARTGINTGQNSDISYLDLYTFNCGFGVRVSSFVIDYSYTYFDNQTGSEGEFRSLVDTNHKLLIGYRF